MKKRIISAFLAVLMALSVFATVISAFNPTDYLDKVQGGEIKTKSDLFTTVEAYLEEMEVVLENDALRMHMRKATGEFAIENKVTGEYIFSNPYATNHRAIISLTYRNNETNGEAILDSYNGAAAFGQLIHKDTDTTDNIYEITFLLGEIVRSARIFLETSSNERMVEIQKMVVDRWIEDFGSIDEVGTVGEAKGIKLSQYINNYLTAARLYELSGLVRVPVEYNGATIYELYYETDKDGSDGVKLDFETDENGFTIIPEGARPATWICKTDLTEKNIRQAEIVYIYAGYTEQMVLDYYDEIGYEPKFGMQQGACFEIPVKYELTQNGFKINVDTSKIEYDKDLYLPISLSILPYMNSATSEDTGYALVPDGSGAIIRFEDRNSAPTTYTVYGSDFAYSDLSSKNSVFEKGREQSTMPIFGSTITTGEYDKAYFAVIEEGDTLASINYINSPKAVYATFAIGIKDKFSIENNYAGGKESDTTDITTTNSRFYQGNCTVNYTVLVDDDLAQKYRLETTYGTTYVDMAECYRDYLIEKGDLKKLTVYDVNEKTKIFFEVFGSIDVTERILTFPVTVSRELTTFNDIITMYKQLNASGVDNASFILTGFANGGLASYYPTYLKWEKSVGGADGYAELVDYAKEAGFEVALNVDFTYSKGTKLFSGFSYKKTAALTVEGRYTTKREYDPAEQIHKRSGGVVISTTSFELAYEKFMESASKYDITALAARTLGSDISSDFDEEDGFVFREQSKSEIQNMLSLLTGNNASSRASYNLILDKGNAYSLKYASSILTTPLESSNMAGAGESVPFVGMVLHGSMVYSGSPINMEGDEDYAFLKSLENGSVLYFTLAMQNIELLKSDYEYNKYYSIDYEQWKSTIVKMYNEYNEVMASKQTSYITEHEFLNAEDGYNTTRIDVINGEEVRGTLDNSRVVRVEYENGEGFILNYNSYEIEVTYNGEVIRIPSMEYVTYQD
ncbi:MAG: hypothetical protein IJZ93_03965 [Clostridia bacterium]|nr:hypothetical protein [Clostridia bacterium]